MDVRAAHAVAGGVLLRRREARRRHRLYANTLVIGNGNTAVDLVDAMRAHPECGLHVVGLVGDEPVRVPGTVLLGPMHRLDELLAEQPIDTVVVAFGCTPDADLVSVLRDVVQRGVTVYVVPRFFELGLTAKSSQLDHLWGIPLQRVKRAGPRRWTWRFKRGMDIVVASTMLVLLAPALAAIAVVVKLSSPGPVLFRQRRVGREGGSSTSSSSARSASPRSRRRRRRWMQARRTSSRRAGVRMWTTGRPGLAACCG